MRTYIQILIFVIIGATLFWLGYLLLMGQWMKFRRERPWLFKSTAPPGDPQICPICSARLYKGDLLETSAYPSVSGGKDRIMHIRGCQHCLSGNFERYCPVCGASLGCNEILVARMFERSQDHRAHVHILGCSRCRKAGTQ
jgi:hypothetical protein